MNVPRTPPISLVRKCERPLPDARGTTNDARARHSRLDIMGVLQHAGSTGRGQLAPLRLRPGPPMVAACWIVGDWRTNEAGDSRSALCHGGWVDVPVGSGFQEAIQGAVA